MAASKPPVNKLYNSILETVLVYGLDENTRGLNIDQQGSIQDDYDKLLTRDINVQFLQVLAPGVVHPSRSSNKTGSSTNVAPPAGTPSGDKSLADGVGINKRFKMEDLGLVWETVESLHHFLYPDGCQLYATEREPACVPIVLTNILGTRTYAMAIKFTRPFFIEKPSSDVRGGHYNLLPWTACMSSLTDTPTNSKLIYLPTAIVMFSKMPYFKLLKEALSGMYRLISEEEREDSFWETIEDVANKLFLIPCLPEGLLSLEVTLPGFSSPTIIMPPRGDLHLDIRLNYPFLCLSVDNVLKVVAALLSEQTIVFTSSNYSMPALVIQCLLSYISPFEWRHSIVPTVPDNFIDILGAPSINILGCHSNWHDSPEFTNIDDAVIVKLDEDLVEPKLSSLSSLPELPEADRNRFKTQYQEILVGDYEVDSLERLVLPSAIERERRKSNFEHYKDTTLSALFLELMVRVFDSIVQDLKKSRAVFEEHLNSLPEKEQFFYKIATQTDMFSLFMMSRRLGVRDNFSILADQIKKYLRPTRSIEGESIVPPPPSNALPLNPLTRRSRISIVSSMLSGQPLKPNIVGAQSLLRHQTITEDKNGPFISWSYSKTSYFKDLQCLVLPQFENKPIERGSYIETVLALLDDMIADKSIQANCMYLCGYYHIASGNVLKGLEILCDDLKRLNSNIVPTLQQRLTFVSLLSPEEKEALQQKCFYKDLIPRQVFQDGYGARHPSNALAFRKIGSHKKTLSHNEFSKEMTQENVTKDPESVSNLFSILQSVGHSASVSVELFQAFLESWKQVVQEFDKASQMMKAQDPIQGVTERILVYNSNLRTNAGSHCQVFLTTHRILVQTQSGGTLNKDKVFGVLSEMNLSSFCKSEMSLAVFGPKVPIIKFDCFDQSMAPASSIVRSRVRITARTSKMTDLYIAFPDVISQELWYRLLKEAIAGWQKFTARKDATVMDHVESHTRLLLALFRTGWTSDVDNNVRHRWCQKILSLQSKPVVIDVKATEALLHRINPNTYNIEKATIESTLFVPSSVTGGEGKLWFGLGNGCLRVYDMEDRCFDSDLKIMDSRRGKTVRVSCLLLVDYNVWVGSLNKTIHILDVETLCHVSQLSNLEDEPRDLALSKSEPMIVWSLLLNGTVLGFDPETRERVAKITVPNMLQHTFCTCFTVYRDFLWVGTNRGTISILSTEYRELHLRNEIAFTESGKTVEVKYLAVSSEDEIWCSVHAIPRAKDSTFIAVYNPRNNAKIYTYSKFQGNDRVSFILPVKNTVWCGTKSGKIYVFSARTENNRDGPKILDAHDDKVRSMTYTDNDLVISGSGSSDGYANVWKLMNWFDE